MNANKIRGIIPPMVTPFLPNEDLDTETLRREVHRLVNAGVDGLSFAGSTGEGALLHDDELALGVSVIREEVGRIFRFCVALFGTVRATQYLLPKLLNPPERIV